MNQDISVQNNIDDNNIIYHYCSVETFKKIVESKMLWLSDSRYMNDPYETIWIDEKVEEALKELENSTNDNKTNIELLRNAYQEIVPKEYFLICFSIHCDLTNQWQGYGDEGRGIAIGFSRNIHISGIVNKSYSVFVDKTSGIAQGDTQKLGWEDVDYDIKNTLKKIIADTVCHPLKIRQNAILLKELASRAKHYEFFEEREVRLTYIPENPLSVDSDSFSDKSIKNISDRKFRQGHRGDIPYYEFHFSDNLQFIQTITLGPQCQTPTEEIKTFLNKHGFVHVIVQNAKN